MTYAAGEAAALTLIQTLSAWDGDNSISLANDSTNLGASLHNAGEAGQYCLLRPGPFESEHASIGNGFVEHHWQTRIEIGVLMQQTSGASPESVLVTLRQNIIDTLDAYFQLNNASVSYAKVEIGDEIQNNVTQNGTPYIFQEMTLVWHEESEITQND